MTLVQADRGDFSDGTTDGKMEFDMYGGKGNHRSPDWQSKFQSQFLFPGLRDGALCVHDYPFFTSFGEQIF